MPKPLHESARTLAEATTGTGDEAGVLEVEFITPGWGSSGYYSREVVEAAAPLFAPGTHMYFDHPSHAEEHDRPERSVRDLAAVLVEAGTVNPTSGGIVGKVKPLAAYKDLLTDEAFAMNVGLSIRGSATDIVVGEAEGRKGPIIEGLAALDSVDFVTRAGRGGRVLAVLESARAAEATSSDRLEQLNNAVRASYAAEGVYVWVRDHDAEETTVWFEVSTEDGPTKTYAQSYSVDANDVDVSLTGDATEVRRVTNYVPVARPGSTTTTEESQEDTMPNIEESELARLREDAGRVTALESERDTAVQERDQLRTSLAERDRNDRARTLIGEAAHRAEVTFTPLEERGLMANLPISEDGALDEAAFTTSLDEAAAQVAEHRGAGKVSGFGGQPAGESTISEADIDAAVGGAFGRTQVKEA